MDRKGTAIVVTCVIFIVAWQFVIGPKFFPVERAKPADKQQTLSPTIPQAVPEEENTPEDTIAPQPVPEMTNNSDAAPADEALPTEDKQPFPAVSVNETDDTVRDIVLQNSVMTLTLTSGGAAVRELRLKHYTDDLGEPLTLMRPYLANSLPLGLQMLKPDVDLRVANYAAQNDRSSASFTAKLSNGLEISKKIQMTPDKYDFSFALEFTNTSSLPIEFVPQLSGPGSMERGDHTQNYLMGAVGYMKNRKPESKSPKPNKPWQIPAEITYEDVSISDIDLVYIGVRNRFFGTALLVDKPFLVRGLTSVPMDDDSAEGSDDKSKKSKSQTLATNIIMPPILLGPGESRIYRFTFYAGPKKADILAEYGPLTELLDYGWFSSISKLLLLLLRFFYSITRNYGIAIILMTIMVKVVLFPLSRKGALSQAKQQKLAPQLKELQAQYKGNKQKLHEETMKLYREEGVNPLGGCLPLLLQIPVFIGLLRLLQYSIELRQAVFIPGWIDDLSRPDTIALLPNWIPFAGGGPLNILPLIMGVVSILHQRMMPKPADPQAQQQMMMMKFMPLMFIFLLYNWPSGLLLYWTMSSGISILEQYLLKRSTGKK